MRSNLKNISILILFLSGLISSGQSDVKLSNFVYTPLLYNPAYAGSSQGYSLTGFYTSQWLGFDGAPETLIVTGHDRIGLTNLAVGFDLLSDQIGASKENRLVGNIAYHVRLSPKWVLSTGIKVGLRNYSIDYNLLSLENPGEFRGFSGEISRMSLIVGTGVFLHRENFFVGLSVPNLLTSEYINDVRNPLAITTQNYYLTSGYKFDLNSDVHLQPTMLVRLAEGAPYSALFSINLDWKEKLYASLNYEHKFTAGAFIGLRITDQIMAGYAYDTPISSFYQNNGGIHSFMINFRAEERDRRDRCGCYTY